MSQSRAETGQFSPATEAAAERRDKAGDIRELLSYEQGLQAQAKEAVTSFLQKSREFGGVMPDWLRVGVMATSLMVAETAMASEISGSDIDERPLAIPEVPRELWRQGPEAPGESSTAELKKFLSEGGEIKIHLQAGNETVDRIGLAAGLIQPGQSLEFAVPIRALEFAKEFAGEAAVPQLARSTTERVAESETYRMTSIDYVDEHGNKVDVMINFDKESNTTVQRIHLIPAQDFSAPGERAAARPLDADLSAFGGPMFEGKFYHHGYEAIMTIGGVGLYSDAASHHDMSELVQPYTEVIGRGLLQPLSLFGQSPELIKRIMFLDTNSRNAFADPVADEIHLHDELFKPTGELPEGQGLGDADKPLPERGIEGVVAHETYHMIDFQIGLSQDVEIITMWHQLGDYSSVFSEHELGGFGGHAGDNTAEFVGSYLNTLDDPNWDKIIRTLTADEIKVHLAVAKVFATSFQQNDKIPDTAPVHALIKERIAYLDETLDRQKQE